MNKAKFTRGILHSLLSLCALACLAPRGEAQTRPAVRTPAVRQPAGRSAASVGVRAPQGNGPRGRAAAPAANSGPHIFRGKLNVIPPDVTRRRYVSKHRAPGDQSVSRQTTLISYRIKAADPNANPPVGPLPDPTLPAQSRDLQPFWSSDERYIFFATDRTSETDTTSNASSSAPNGTLNIFHVNPDGSGITQVTTGTDNKIEPNVQGISRLAYANGGTITYSPTDQSIAATTGFQLIYMNTSVTPATVVNLTARNPQLFRFADVRHPSWDPGGNRIVFAGRIVGDSVYHLFIVNVNTNNITQMTQGPSNDTAPAWSPDGSLIAYTSNASAFSLTAVAPISAGGTKANTDIWVLDANPLHPAPQQVTNSAFTVGIVNGVPSNNRNPAWSSLRVDPQQIVPPGINPVTQNPQSQGLLAFASDRVFDAASGAFTATTGSTDIYWLNASTALDTRAGAPAGAFTVDMPEGAGNPGLLLRTTTPGFQNDPDAVNRPEASANFDGNPFAAPPVPGVTSEDYPAWPQYINSYRIAFQSNRGNNLNIWAATIFDINAPALLKYDLGTNQIVGMYLDSTNPPLPGTTGADRGLLRREFSAGDKVRFRVRAADYETGVQNVYVQIKNPSSQPQDTLNKEHKIFYDGTTVVFPGPILMGLIDNNQNIAVDAPYEFECQAINPLTYAYPADGTQPNGNVQAFLGGGATPGTWPGWNPSYAGIDDAIAFIGGIYDPATNTFAGGTITDTSFWLQVYDDGPVSAGGNEPPGEAKGDGIYSNVWTTPSDNPSDWYLDVIVTDRAVDPFDPTFATNWKIYDNVWGFTTQPFVIPDSATLLYVNDYDIGQKFFQAHFGNSQTGILSYSGVPTESWMTEINPALLPVTWVNIPNPMTTGPLINVRQPMGQLSYGFAPVPIPDYNPTDRDYRTFEDPAGPFGNGLLVTQNYAQWRILSRGPVPDSVLGAFTPHTVVQPRDQFVAGSLPRVVTVAERCVFWHAPYTGDLFVGPGTLLDSAVQNQLKTFVTQRGGRLFLSGQDVAWGVSLGGGLPAVGSFLDSVFHVSFVSDTGGTLAITPSTTGSGTAPIVTQTWIGPQHMFPGQTGRFDPPSLGLSLNGLQGFVAGANYACPNTSSLDIIAFTPPTANGGTDATNGGPSITWYTDNQPSGIRSKVVFSTLPWEAILPGSFDAPPPPLNPLNSKALNNRRAELIHNVGDYLRTGRIVGQVRSTAGGFIADPVFIRATGANGVIATTFSQSDGNYVLEGLEPNGVYLLDAYQPGFVTLHTDGDYFHGGNRVRVDLFLTPIQPGTISGQVVVDATGAPVPGAIVVAYDPINNAKTYTATTDANGNYQLTGLPAISDPTGATIPLYVVRVTNIDALNYGSSVPSTYGLFATDLPASFPNSQPGVNVAAGQNTGIINFRLKQRPGDIAGTVKRNNPAQTPIGGATVTAQQGTQTFTATSKADGTYSFNDAMGAFTLPPGSYNVFATAPGFQDSALKTIPVTTNVATNNTDTTFLLDPSLPGTLSGKVTLLSNGAPLAGVTISLQDANGNPIKDADGNVVTPGTTASDGTYSFSAPSGTIQVVAAKAGYTNVTGILTQTITAAMTTANVNFVLDPKASFSSGLQLVSAPQEYTTNIFDLLKNTDGTALTTSDRTNARFLTWLPGAAPPRYTANNAAPADTFHRGRGYFLYVPNGAVLISDGTGSDTDIITVPLQTGWNLIGNPYSFPLDFAQVAAGASDPTAVGSALFAYQGGSYTLSFTIDAYRGYWIRASSPVNLVFKPEYRATRAAANVAANIKGDGWMLNLSAQAGDKYAAPGYLGVSRAAQDGFDRYKLETPPSIGAEGVTLSFEHNDWGDKSGKYTMDVRSAAQTQQSWTFTVNSTVANAPVTLRWPAVAEVPGKQSLMLTDLDSNITVNLRNRSSYVIAASDKPLTRRFRLDVHRAGRQKLQLSDVLARKGSGRSPGVVISYRLSAEADVQVNILQNGRHIRALEPGRHRAPGPADVSWDLRNDKGVAIAGDTYTVEVRAADADGNVVRQVTPLLITR